MGSWSFSLRLPGLPSKRLIAVGFGFRPACAIIFTSFRVA
jgi:hypothetical protein